MSVDLSAIAANVPNSATVFVFVREVGQRMPLGVEQYSVATLPPVVTFATDKEYSEVEVVARVSRSGKVERAADDHEAQVTTRFAESAKPITLSFAEPGAKSPAQTLTTTAHTPPVKTGTTKVEIRLEAKLPSDVAQQFASNTVIYVTAKSPEQTMPLAVKRMTFGELPTRITLTDQDAMLPGRGLSSVGSFFLSARISRSGNASREPGDWEGIAKDSDRLADGSFAIAIDQVIN